MYRTTFIGAALIALLPLTAPSAPAVSAGGSVADAQQAATYKVTAKANMTVAIAREDTIIIRGRVTPEAAGQVVLLQQKVGKTSWKNSGKAKIKSAGTYVLKDKPTTSGVHFYRVVKPASEGLRRGISKSLEVGVFAWQKLARLAPSASTGISVAGVTVAADHLSPSLVASTPGTPGYVEFTLGRRCVALVATYALTDASASGATGTISVSTDGTNRLTQPLAVGTIVRNHVIDLIDVFRIRFDMTSSGTPAAYPAVVVPWVLCI